MLESHAVEYPLLHVALTESYRVRRRKTESRRNREQGFTVVLSGPLAVRKDILVAAHLHVLFHEKVCQPAKRVDPMYTQEQIRDHPDPVVFPLKVISFMRYGDLFAFRLEVKRDIDHRSDQSHKKRRFDISLVYTV